MTLPAAIAWHPEDPAFWEAEGRAVANRNLWISIPALSLAFSVWMVWSVVVVNLPQAGFGFSTPALFWLSALPALSGALLRLLHARLLPLFGGRRWTAISTALLLLPTLGMGYAVREATTPYAVFVLLALLCGLGGGNFASSMANINLFFPRARKATAVGLNAGLGNLGVSLVQFVVPLVITAGWLGSLGGEPQAVAGGRSLWLQNAGFVWVPLIVVCALAAWFGMDDIAVTRVAPRLQARLFGRAHGWIMGWLYLGTFGSFLGYAAGFPLLGRSQFPQADVLVYAWLGPLLGALIRPLGGWLSDKLGGAQVTFWNFIAMAGAVAGVLCFLTAAGEAGNFHGFLTMFMLLFISAGLGNGSTERMQPAAAAGEGALQPAVQPAFSSALAACGGFFIPGCYGAATLITGSAAPAHYVFLFFYLTCIALTWWFYARPQAASRT